jgi:hypothetical protein
MKSIFRITYLVDFTRKGAGKKPLSWRFLHQKVVGSAKDRNTAMKSRYGSFSQVPANARPAGVVHLGERAALDFLDAQGITLVHQADQA